MWYHPRNSDSDPSSAGWQALVRLDTTIPNTARMHDYLLGGKDNYAADRAAAGQVLELMPHSAQAARLNRAFIGRAVRYLAAEAGIRQFLDIGSGMPAALNVHEIAQAVNPSCQVVYVDYDDVVVSHSRVKLEGGSATGVSVAVGDVRDPDRIIRDAECLLDFTQPVVVLLFAVLQFIRDDEKPHEVVRTLTAALPPGSALALSHITGEGADQDKNLAVQQVYQGASAPLVPRSREEVTRFFDGLDLTEPGVTDINLWPAKIPGPVAPLAYYGGIAEKH